MTKRIYSEDYGIPKFTIDDQIRMSDIRINNFVKGEYDKLIELRYDVSDVKLFIHETVESALCLQHIEYGIDKRTKERLDKNNG